MARPLFVDQGMVVEGFIVGAVREEGDTRPEVGEVNFSVAGKGTEEEVGCQFLDGGAHGGVERDMASQVGREVGLGREGQGGDPVLPCPVVRVDLGAEAHQGIAVTGSFAEDLHPGGLLPEIGEVPRDHLLVPRREMRQGQEPFEKREDIPLPERFGHGKKTQVARGFVIVEDGVDRMVEGDDLLG